MTNLTTIGAQAKSSAKFMNNLSTKEKNQALLEIASHLKDKTALILEENQKDIAAAKENNLANAMLDRLLLTEDRIHSMIDSIKTVVELPDPIGMVDKMWVTEEELQIGKKRVPIGVIGIIYESRPNVTIEAASLCFKAGNSVILRGGKDAFHSNVILTSIMQEALEKCHIPKEVIQYVTDTSRESATELMKMNDYLDLLIPRGGAGLIQTVIKTATVPVIETGTGNCHLYIDKEADVDKAVSILVNGKCQRPSVCNALETLIVHEKIAPTVLPKIEQELATYNVEIRGDDSSRIHLQNAIPATEEDFATEFLDYILAIKTVANIDEAIEHIDKYSTKHSEAIISESYSTVQDFLQRVDAAVVYANASTRFTDGSMFGFGGEIGISTQKLHARGPMGLEALTSSKYMVYGNGQVRQ